MEKKKKEATATTKLNKCRFEFDERGWGVAVQK
jgi:hypothetical protein